MVKDPETNFIKELNNIKSLQSELQELKEGLLGTNRETARIMLIIVGNYYYSQAGKHPITNQIIADSTKALSAIETSDEPIVVVKEFQVKYAKVLEKLGITNFTYLS